MNTAKKFHEHQMKRTERGDSHSTISMWQTNFNNFNNP